MENDKELKIELKQYPSNFDLYDEVQLMSKDYIQKVLEKLINEFESSPYDTSMETLRALNLMSFLSFILGNNKDAFDYNSKVLELSKDNIVGLCNKAWFLLKMQEQYSVIKDLCIELNAHIENKVYLLIAKAEKAFCYSRFGVNRYEKSRQLFEEVLKICEPDVKRSCETGESEQNLIGIDDYCVWNFGYALTFKRALNFNNTHESSSFELSKQSHVKVCNLYCHIICMEGDSMCLKRYQARSYVELGLLIYNIRKNKSVFPNGIKDVIPDHRDLWLPTKNFFVKAKDLCPDDVFVLERCGRYFRYINYNAESINLLKKALSGRQTAFSHHHLALSLKRQLEVGTWKDIGKNYSDTKEKQNVSRNLSSKFEEVDSHLPKNENYYTPTSILKTSGASNTKNNTHKQRKNLQMKSKNTHLQTPGSSFGYVQPERMQSLGSKTTSTSKTNVDIRTNIPDEAGFERVCDMLSYTSLDSGYETLSSASNVTMKDHVSASNVESNVETFITDSKNQTVSSKGENKKRLRYKNQGGLERRCDSSFEGEIMRERHERYQGDCEKGVSCRYYSNVNQNVHGRSESVSGYNDYKLLRFRSETRGSKNFSSCPKRKERSTEVRTPFTGKITFLKMIKSPQKPPLIKTAHNMDAIEKIIFHLDKSYELSNNCGAIYDKGLLYRQIKEHEKALATFKILIRNEGGHCSLVQLSNAYEQSGLCLYDILSQSEEENKSKENDMRTYFKKSIEISCAIVSKIPFLKDCWVSAPTLREFLSGKAKTTEYLKDLVFLSKKLENYGEAISVLKDLKEMIKDEKEKTKIDLQLVENYLRSGNYDDAVLALDAVVCLQNGYKIIDEELYLQAHIEGGIVALKQGSFEMARLRLRNALDFCRHNQNAEEIEDDTDTEEEKFDIFMLCNEEIEEKSLSLEHVLKSFKLRVSINSRHLLPGTSKMAGLYHLFQRSKHFLLIVDETPLCRITEFHFELMHEVVLKRNFGHIVIVKTSRDAKTPLQFSKFPNMEMNFEADEVSDFDAFYENESLCEKVKELLMKVASSKTSA